MTGGSFGRSPILRDSEIHNCTQYGVEISHSNAVVEGCRIWQDGLQYWTGQGVSGVSDDRIMIPSIRDCVIEGFSTGIHLSGRCDALVTGNKISNQQLDGLFMSNGGRNRYYSSLPTINHNIIQSNGRYAINSIVDRNDVEAAGRQTIDATNNWWGTTDPTEVADLIYEQADSPDRKVVNFTPFLLVNPQGDYFDEDGLSDSWERLFFGTEDHPDARPEADPDGDGQDNAFEELAGLDPTDSNSRFEVSVSKLGQSVDVTFWPIVEGRTYRVLKSETLAPGSFLPLSGNPSISEGDGARTVSETEVGASKCFYSIEILRE